MKGEGFHLPLEQKKNQQSFCTIADSTFNPSLCSVHYEGSHYAHVTLGSVYQTERKIPLLLNFGLKLDLYPNKCDSQCLWLLLFCWLILEALHRSELLNQIFFDKELWANL